MLQQLEPWFNHFADLTNQYSEVRLNFKYDPAPASVFPAFTQPEGKYPGLL